VVHGSGDYPANALNAYKNDSNYHDICIITAMMHALYYNWEVHLFPGLGR